MTMSRFKSAAVAAALLAAGCRQCSAAQAIVLVNHGFENRTTLAAAGWVITNNGTRQAAPSPGSRATRPSSRRSPVRPIPTWPRTTTTPPPGGYINSVIATPVFATDFATTVTFSARADLAAGYFDYLSWGFSSGAAQPQVARPRRPRRPLDRRFHDLFGGRAPCRWHPGHPGIEQQGRGRGGCEVASRRQTHHRPDGVNP